MTDRFRHPIDAPYRERAPARRSHAVGYALCAMAGGVSMLILLVITGMVRP